MPRNSQGQYFLPDGNPVVAGELVKAEWANSTLDDVANAITNSLDRSGAGGMTGQFKAASGTVLRPGMSFVEDPATGIYKESQGVMALAASGIKQAYVTQNGLFVSNAPSDKMEVANKAYVDSLASQATEIIMAFGASKTPEMLPANGYIPANWDATGSPAFAIQFSQGQSAVYRPANTSDPLYNHVYVYVSTNTIAAGWIDIGTVAGPPGPQGEVGPIGPIGPQGPEGAQGPTGATGPLGPVGPIGPQGPQGPQGAKGDTGPAGQSVTIIGAFGVSKTPADLPSNGFIPANWDSPGNPANDIQLVPGQALIYTEVPQSDPLYGHLFEYVGLGTGFDSNGWVDLGDIQGPAGPQGPQGPQGIQGNVGPQGPAGTDGAQGPQGPAGAQGAKGDTGAAGAQGPQGIKGDTGPQGPKGDTGPQGPAGPAGGVSSVNGFTGAVTLTAQNVGAAPTASPAFTGVPTAPTAGFTTSNDQIATTKFVQDWGTNNTIFGKLAGTQTWSGTNTWTGPASYTGTTVTFGASTPVTFKGTVGVEKLITCIAGMTVTGAMATFNAGVTVSGANNTFNGGTTFGVVSASTNPEGQYATYYGANTSTGKGWHFGELSSHGYCVYENSGVGGAFIAPGQTTWAGRSDLRLKDNLQPIQDALGKIDSLTGYTGNYLSDGSDVSRLFLVAQEVQQVFPQVVVTAPATPNDIGVPVGEDVLAIMYSEMIPPLVQAIKELKAEVDALKAQVNK